MTIKKAYEKLNNTIGNNYLDFNNEAGCKDYDELTKCLDVIKDNIILLDCIKKLYKDKKLIFEWGDVIEYISKNKNLNSAIKVRKFLK